MDLPGPYRHRAGDHPHQSGSSRHSKNPHARNAQMIYLDPTGTEQVPSTSKVLFTAYHAFLPTMPI